MALRGPARTVAYHQAVATNGGSAWVTCFRSPGKTRVAALPLRGRDPSGPSVRDGDRDGDGRVPACVTSVSPALPGRRRSAAPTHPITRIRAALGDGAGSVLGPGRPDVEVSDRRRRAEDPDRGSADLDVVHGRA